MHHSKSLTSRSPSTSADAQFRAHAMRPSSTQAQRGVTASIHAAPGGRQSLSLGATVSTRSTHTSRGAPSSLYRGASPLSSLRRSLSHQKTPPNKVTNLKVPQNIEMRATSASSGGVGSLKPLRKQSSIKPVIPADYTPIDPQQKKKQSEPAKAVNNTSVRPGEYTLYQSGSPRLALASGIALSLICASHLVMIPDLVSQKTFGFGEYTWYAIAALELAAIGFGQYSFSRRYLQRITANFTQERKLPKTVNFYSSNFFGGEKLLTIPITLIKGLSTADRRAGGITRDSVNAFIEVDMKNKHFFLLPRKAKFSNPLGLLSTILKQDDVSDIVNMKGFTHNGKLYSDADYEYLIKKLDNKDIAQTSSAIKKTLDELVGDDLSSEQIRQRGVLTRDQEIELLDRALKSKFLAIEATKKANSLHDGGQIPASIPHREQAKEHHAAYDEAVKLVIKSMVERSRIEEEPEIDLHGFTAEGAGHCFKAVLEGLAKKHHPRATRIRIICGAGNHSDENGPKIKPMLLLYLDDHKYKYTEENHGSFLVTLK